MAVLTIGNTGSSGIYNDTFSYNGSTSSWATAFTKTLSGSNAIRSERIIFHLYGISSSNGGGIKFRITENGVVKYTSAAVDLANKTGKQTVSISSGSQFNIQPGYTYKLEIQRTSTVAAGLFMTEHDMYSTLEPNNPHMWIEGEQSHSTSVTFGSSTPATSSTNLTPTFGGNFSDNLGHSLASYDLALKQGSTTIASVNDKAGSGTSWSHTFSGVTLTPGTTYTATISDAKCTLGFVAPSVTKTFSTVARSTTASILGPIDNQVNIEPNLVGSASNNYGASITRTHWEVWEGTTRKGETLSTVNNLNLKYDGNASSWAPGWQPLEYGKTYKATLVAYASDGTQSPVATRTFVIGGYSPTATLTAPLNKIDTLTPTISGNYFSNLGFAKGAHRFLVMNTARQIIASKTVENSTSPYSTTYDNTDLSWTTFTPLQWDTTYIFAVLVRDNQNVWSTTTSGKESEKTIKTNSAPTTPSNLSPGGGGVSASKRPQLYAKFNDIDVGDTPIGKEVELRRASDNALMLQRFEATATETFEVLLSDNLQINETYTWRVRYTDQGNLVGAWSAWTTFTVVEGAEVALTNPTQNQVLTTPIQTFTWTYTHPNSLAQATGRLRIFPATGSVPLYDSGVQSGSYVSQVMPTSLLQNNTTYRAFVNVSDANGDEADSGYVYFSTSWTGPSQPAGFFGEADHDDASIALYWTQASPTNFVSYRLYRREAGSGASWNRITEIEDYSVNSYTYYYAPSNIEYEYAITRVDTSSGAALESTISEYISITLYFPHDTWLNDNFEPAYNRLRLKFNPNRSESNSRSSILINTIGRRNPVLHVGRQYDENLSVTFMIRLPYAERAVLDMFLENARPLLYRDGRGRRAWVWLSGYTIRDSGPRTGELQLQVTKISMPQEM